MDAFSKYFLELFSEIWEDIKAWFQGIWETLFADVFNNLKNYFEILKSHANAFGFVGWFLFLLSSILILIFLYFVIVRLFYLVKKYIKFLRSEIEKDELQEQIRLLNEKIMEVINEKNKILAMKVSQLGGSSVPEIETRSTNENIRFPKLHSVDLQYDMRKLEISMNDEEQVSLQHLVDYFVHFCSSKLGLYYNHKTIMLFLASMATSKVIILEGISGMGKTSLPYALGKFFKHQTPIISVQPSWRDRAELLGYLNEFTKRFNETDFLKSLYEVLYRTDNNFIVLDEMNLARIEYYFAEFLSIMELPDKHEWKIDLVPDVWDNDPKMLINGKLTIPQNIWFVGTANKDDSTFTITDKVYDRAMTIEIDTRAEPFEGMEVDSINMSYDYLNNLFEQAKMKHEISENSLKKLDKLNDFMIDKFKLAIGNRIIKQIENFVPVFIECGGTENEALDYILAHKIIKKFEVLNIAFFKDELEELKEKIQKSFGKTSFTESIRKIEDLQRLI